MTPATASLEGLSVGDALGSQFFVPANRAAYETRSLPPAPWPWTDDTEMACVLLAHLRAHGHVVQDELAAGFARDFDLYRGYGPGAGRLLRQIRDGGDWRALASASFGGTGSLGNGAAMRVAPLGAWFAGNLDLAVEQARLSAEVTHAHPDGVAGAVAVAVAAALAVRGELALDAVIARTPAGAVRDGLGAVGRLRGTRDPRTVAAAVGNGSRTTAADTVPFCVWAAVTHLGDYEGAFWATAEVGGDIDTNGAIVGGIVAAGDGGASIPAGWRESRERLPV